MATRSSKKRQARLTFSPLPSSSPATSSYNQQIRDRAAVVSYDSPHSVKRRKVRDAPGIHSFLEARSSEPKQLATPEATKNKSQSSSQPKTIFFGSQRKAKRKQTTLDDSDDDEDEDEDQGLPTARTSRASAHRQQPPVSILNNKKQNLISQSTRSHARRFSDSITSSIEPTKRASVKFINFDQSDSDSEPLPTAPAARRRNRAAKGDKSSPVQIDSDSDDLPVRSGRRARQQSSPAQPSSVLNDDDEDDIPRSSTRRIRRARPQSDEEISEGAEDDVVELSSAEEASEDDDDETTPNSKRKLTSAEQQELDDDLQDLQSSSPGTLDGRPRNSQRARHASALEKLKQRRAGKQVVESDEDEDEEQSDDEVQEVVNTSRSMFRPDEDDEGFLEDDDNDTLGVPAGIPLQFTRYATSSARDLFRYAVEWMVQKKLNPAFLMTDEIYTLSFNKLDDEVKGLAGSKFISAAWASQFHLALRARPQIGMQLIDRNSAEHFMRNKCDACNRSNHPATWELQFLGRPYNKTTLEEIAPNDDDDDDSDSSSDRDGEDQANQTCTTSK